MFESRVLLLKSHFLCQHMFNIQNETMLSNLYQMSSFSFYLGRIPHVCGGKGTQPIQECYRYVPANDTWVVSGTLAHLHVSSGYAYHNEFGLVMTGNANGASPRNKIENLLDNMTIQVQTCIKTILKYEV